MEGQYQQYVNDLPSLELYRYENIFKVFQTGEKNFYYYNILKTIKVPDDINSDIFLTYTYPSGTPFTTLSYQIYGTTYLWWLICIINKIENPFDTSLNGKTLKIIKKEYLKPILDNIKQQLQWDLVVFFPTLKMILNVLFI